MGRFIKLGIVYLFFVLLSGGVHAALIWGIPKWSEVKQKMRRTPPLTVEVAMAPAAEPPTPDPVPIPVPLFRETEKVRTEDPNPEPVVRAPAESEPEPEPKPEPEKPRPVPKVEDAPKPKETRAEVRTVQEYRRFLTREMPPEGASYPYVPKIRFGENTATENAEIMRYFGMELIAYPEDRRFYIYIDPLQDLYSKSTEITYLENFSNRVIFRESAYFRTLRDKAAEHAKVPSTDLKVAQLLKARTAQYVAWKQKLAAEAAGVAIEEIELCEASFVKAPAGVWIARIDTVLLRNGGSKEVEDAEWKKVGGKP